MTPTEKIILKNQHAIMTSIVAVANMLARNSIMEKTLGPRMRETWDCLVADEKPGGPISAERRKSHQPE